MARPSRMLFPLAPHLGYSRVARPLQRVKFIVWHLGEGHDPMLKESFGLASCRLRGLVKVRSYILLIGPPSVLKVSRETFALRAMYLPRLRHNRV